MTQADSKQSEKPKDPPPRPVSEVGFSTDGNSPTPNKKGVIGGFNLGGLGSVVPALLVALVVYTVMLPGYVTKKDFTSNIQTMISAIDKAKVDVTQTTNTALTNQTNDVNSKVTNLTNQIANVQSNLSNYATKGSVDALSGLSAQVTNQLATAKTAQDTAIASALASVDAKIVAMATNTTAQVSMVSSTTKDEIKVLNDKITVLQTQILNTQTLANVSISGTSNNISFPIPSLIITNSNSVTVDTTNMTVLLTMTPPTGIVITSPNYTITSSAGLISSTTATLRTTLGNLGISSVAPGTVTIPPPNIPLVATPSANITSSWLAVWSKN